MTRAIIQAWHKYTPFGKQFYEPILDFQLQQLKKFQSEFDRVYLIDSTWDIKWTSERNWDKATVIKVNPSLRYYDAYKEVLPQIKEDLVLFMDNDMLVWKEGVIKETFHLLQGDSPSSDMDAQTFEPYDVVSIYDTIGTYQTNKMNGKNKFCPYWFATRKELLMKYLGVSWADNMPHSETLGKLTEAMLNDNIKPFEWMEDKSSIYMEDNVILRNPLESKKLGYYHVRAGSASAYLLASKNSPEHEHTYKEYITNQPKREYLRQCAWYQYMGGDPTPILQDVNVLPEHWKNYMEEFKKYHGL